MVYPDGVWYAQVRASDVAEIVEEHLVNGRVVERLALLKIPAVEKCSNAEPSENWDA
jgi:(2Fe-2S) ferredoxin